MQAQLGRRNRASKTLNGVTHTYTVDNGDKLTSTSSKSYTYDTAGRCTAVTVGGGTTSLAYDYENRVTSITYPSTATNTFTYNALDTRVGKVDSGGTFTYKRDGVSVTDPVINDAAASYTPGVSERRSGTSKFYHGERQGSNVLETNSSQTATATKTFDAFGMLISSSGSSSSPFGYVGQQGYQSDGDSGLMLLGHRYYDSSTGRFLTRDKAKRGRNWYGYCNGGPNRRVDPDGLWSVGLTLGADIASNFGVGASITFAIDGTGKFGIITEEDAYGGFGGGGVVGVGIQGSNENLEPGATEGSKLKLALAEVDADAGSDSGGGSIGKGIVGAGEMFFLGYGKFFQQTWVFHPSWERVGQGGGSASGPVVGGPSNTGGYNNRYL